MKMTIFLTMAFSMCAFAEGKAQNVTLHVEDMTLRNVMKEIQKQQGYSFFFRGDRIAQTRITAEVKQADLSQTMEHILRGHHLGWSLDDGIISIWAKPLQKISVSEPLYQQKKITGRVTDEQGSPLEGVTIRMKNTTAVTTTTTDGHYEMLLTDEGETLVFTTVGYETVEYAIGNQVTLNVSMKASLSDLDEVVVVGYGVQRKVNLTGAVSSVDFERGGMQSRPLQNVSSALAGMASGLAVNQSSGHPGASASLTVRGTGSLNASQNPLVIIDGQVGDINAVNPSDVASVSVLKDAASAAIYGSRASNGVVLITTKTGTNNEGKVDFNYTGNIGRTDAARVFDIIDNTVEQMQLINLVQRNSGIEPSFSEERMTEWREGSITDPLLYPNTNWWDALLNKGTMHNHNLSARGGNDRIHFFSSLGYLENGGTVPNTGMHRFNFRNNLSYKINEWLELGNTLTALYSESDPGTDNNIFQWFETLTPGTLPKHPDGRYGISMTGGSEFSANNPLRAAETQMGENARQRYTGKLFANITPLEGLKITGSYFVDFYNYNDWTSNRPVDSWNFQTNTIGLPDAPRDASSAAIVASALLDLSDILDKAEEQNYYREWATRMLRSLSSEAYRSNEQNNAFLLHSTGSKTSEIDVSINYADYYYLEALMRLYKSTKN